jgi:hypothetical protein
MNLNLVLLRSDAEQWQRMERMPAENRRIDIWWKGDATSRLMLLLAHLMRRSVFWGKSYLRVLGTNVTTDLETAKSDLEHELEEMRIDARVSIPGRKFAEAVEEESNDAAFVFLPFRIAKNRIRSHMDESLERLLPRLPATALVMAAEEIDLDAEPEEGIAADLAAAADALAETEKKAVQAENDAARKKEKASDLMEMIQSAEKLSELSQGEVSKLHEDTIQAIAESEKAFRKARKARAKAVLAAKTAADLGLKQPQEKNSEVKE